MKKGKKREKEKQVNGDRHTHESRENAVREMGKKRDLHSRKHRMWKEGGRGSRGGGGRG